ncbi:hypothetical protein [Sphingobium sp. MK2]|uniref:hypothetical protein n=1 Tax=Sphingobium sp. MK2 TaxID=3116540 RepID=UPI0032E3596E
MPKFEVCVIETREHFFEIEAEDAEDAEAFATDLDTGTSLRDAFREQQVDWVRPLPDMED